MVAESPILVPPDDLGEFSCGDGVTPEPFLLQTPACGGGAKNNNGIDVTATGPGQTGVCFFAQASATKFPYVSP